MNPSEEEVRAYLTDMAYQHEILSRAEAYRHAAAIFRAALALLDAARKDRERLVGVQEKIGKLPKYSPRGGVEYFDCDDVLAVLGNGA